MLRLLGDLKRQAGPHRQDAVASSLQTADRALDLDERLGERRERIHLLESRVCQCRHTFSEPGASDIEIP